MGLRFRKINDPTFIDGPEGNSGAMMAGLFSGCLPESGGVIGRGVPAGPNEDLRDRDLRLLGREADLTSQHCVALAALPFHAASIGVPFRGRVLPVSFCLVVRWCPPPRRSSRCVTLWRHDAVYGRARLLRNRMCPESL